MIDKATAEKIKETADIVEVVGDYVRLTRRGANYMGLCPFHNERTPSFSVNRSKNFCYCFSCHKGGSPVNFIMEKEGISYQDALRQLARKYGITIEERELTDAERQAQSEREAMFVANEWAMSKFMHFLNEDQEGINVGLSYLYGRGITDEAIRHFKLGYSPDRNVLVDLARKEGFNTEILQTLGLLGKSQNGQLYDRFRGRIIYPVLNAAGKVVAFGGRDLKGSRAKYINSPETPIYHKSNELYGLHQARSEMGRRDHCFLVEGYMDVIGMWQAGVRNAIASSGTALTDAQIALIHRFTGNATLVYDGDAAGIKASMRGIDMLLAHGMDLRVLLLPDGHDPDSFARQVSAEEFQEYFEKQSTDFISFKTKVLLQDAANDPIRRTQAARSIVTSLGSIGDKIKRNVYIQECSRQLGIDEQILSYEADTYAQKLIEQGRMQRLENRERQEPAQAAELSSPTQQSETQPKVPVKVTPLIRLERNLMRLCVRYGMMPFYVPEDTETDEQPQSMLLVEYVKSELDVDNITFQDTLCHNLLSEILGMRDSFVTARESYEQQKLAERAERFNEEVSQLATSEMTIHELENAERNVQERLDVDFNNAMLDFSAEWLSRLLISHEKDEIRLLASKMVAEPYTLSRYHLKAGKVLAESERLGELVPRALNELRAGIIDSQIETLKHKLAEAGDEQLCVSLMQELSEKQEIRKNFAFYNGERILSNRY